MQRRELAGAWRLIWILAAQAAMAGMAGAEYLQVYLGPMYWSNYRPALLGDGLAVSSATKEYSGGDYSSRRAVVWGTSGFVRQLSVLGAYGESQALGVSAAGQIVGQAKTSEPGLYLGQRAVRWDASGAATELTGLSVHDDGVSTSMAAAVNNAGTVVGSAELLDGVGKSVGDRAVRWDAGSRTPIELGDLEPTAGGFTSAAASAINDAGTVIGWSRKYSEIGEYLGERVVRWEAGSTEATELIGYPRSIPMWTAGAVAIDNAGTAIGWMQTEGWPYFRRIGMRWEAGSAVGTELEGLGGTWTDVADINEAGTIVGASYKDEYLGSVLGKRAVRWEAGSTTATELGVLGTNAEGRTTSVANGINGAGTVVGMAVRFEDEQGENVAVMWGPDGVAVDLNTLIDPQSEWVLKEAFSVSDTGWILGRADRGQPRSLPSSDSLLFLMHVPGAVPEPGTMGLVVLGALVWGRRRRGN